MKWLQEVWSIRKLLDLYEGKKINLAPEYQRNAIWTASAQKSLLDTILAPQPIPNFFLLEKEDGLFEMVDGQQRARAIINFAKGHLTATGGRKINGGDDPEFYLYPLNITKINELCQSESIEKFYALVNSSGLRLNTPELRKAEFFETRYLELCTELASAKAFNSLNLFTEHTSKRMNDVELISELIALLHFGRSEKKIKVDALYESDITEREKESLKERFLQIVGLVVKFNEFKAIASTRYRQRADLYTLFDFISCNQNVDEKSFVSYYKILTFLAEGIRPTQEKCDPLRDYARNCVSQSNSLRARKERFEFMNLLFRNPIESPNQIQEKIISYLHLPGNLVQAANCWTIDTSEFEEV